MRLGSCFCCFQMSLFVLRKKEVNDKSFLVELACLIPSILFQCEHCGCLGCGLSLIFFLLCRLVCVPS